MFSIFLTNFATIVRQTDLVESFRDKHSAKDFALKYAPKKLDNITKGIEIPIVLVRMSTGFADLDQLISCGVNVDEEFSCVHFCLQSQQNCGKAHERSRKGNTTIRVLPWPAPLNQLIRNRRRPVPT